MAPNRIKGLIQKAECNLLPRHFEMSECFDELWSSTKKHWDILQQEYFMEV